jgi:hypothetical protein
MRINALLAEMSSTRSILRATSIFTAMHIDCSSFANSQQEAMKNEEMKL